MASKPPIALDIPAGIVKVDSPNAAKGRYTDCDKVRFERGRPEKWAGWIAHHDQQLNGSARGALSWVNQYGQTTAAIGTNLKLYAITGGDTLADITPVRSTGTLATDPFDTTISSTTVVVNHTAHGAEQGDYVTFSGATAVGGITIDGEYQITVKLGVNSYEIEHSVAATSTATGGGAAVDYEYQINTGSSGTAAGLGWGAGPWGESTWSTPRADGIPIEFRFWSLAAYGNDLLANPSDDSLFFWQEDTDNRAPIVTNAPANIRAMFVTGERFIFALGTSSPMTVQWPDRDDMTDWTPTATNTANIRTLQEGSKLMGGSSLADGVSLVWSDTGVYLFQYTGSNFVYDSRLVASNAGLVGPLAFAKSSGSAFWMGAADFYMYNGSVQGIPNAADIKDYVFLNINETNADKTWAIFDQQTNQIRWHYCSALSDEPDLYVDVSLDDWSWTVGTLDRTTGCLYQEDIKTTLLVDHDGYIFQHGTGRDADTAALESYITYGLYAIGDGSANVDVMGVIPDTQRQTGNLSYEVYTKERPNSASNFDSQTLTVTPTTEIADSRISGRHFGMTVRSNVVGGDFRLGIPKLEIGPSGDKR